MTAIDRLLDAAGIVYASDHPIGLLTTYRVGGRARWYAEICDADQLARLAACRPALHARVCVVGKGSNLLVADSGFDGLAIRLAGRFEAVTVDGTAIEAGGAALMPVAARRSAAAGLRGFEWAVGVPGTIGGAVRMNAGGHGSDMAAVLESAVIASLASGETRSLRAAALAMAYRWTNLGPADVVVSARIALARGSATDAEATVTEIVRWRREHQPGGQNAGSVFTNPPGDSAGRLIDAAGCKGLRIGTASVSKKHANFFLADDGGRADDIYALMREVQRRVSETFGVDLQPETHLLGFDSSPRTLRVPKASR